MYLRSEDLSSKVSGSRTLSSWNHTIARRPGNKGTDRRRCDLGDCPAVSWERGGEPGRRCGGTGAADSAHPVGPLARDLRISATALDSESAASEPLRWLQPHRVGSVLRRVVHAYRCICMRGRREHTGSSAPAHYGLDGRGQE